MHFRRFQLARLVRSGLVPLAIALPPLAIIITATRRASYAPLGRDQGIFQYVAWALLGGAIDYRDLKDVNGPVTHLVHLVLLLLGGSDEHRFRVLDLAINGATFALVGACLPGLRDARGSASGTGYAVTHPRGPLLSERLLWALAGWVVLSGQYLTYNFWHTAQRESFFDWFMLPSVGLQLAAQSPAGSRIGSQRLLVVAGALSIVPWFGKPTYAVFTLIQGVTLLIERPTHRSRLASLAFFCGGALASASTMVAALAVTGDLPAYLRIQFVEVPTMYRFIWYRTPLECLTTPWAHTPAICAAVGCALTVALLACGRMPRRVATVAFLPLGALASAVLQAKGFPYHYHPVSAGVHLQWLLLAAWLTERLRIARRDRALLRLLPLAAALGFSLQIWRSAKESPSMRDPWLAAASAAPEIASEPAFISHFTLPDFFPLQMRKTAAFLRDHTLASDRVQTYGMDPYVLFLAHRRSATPYLYAYDLNADASLAGGSGAHPSQAQSMAIRAFRDAHENDLLARVQASPPAAFVFFDRAPLLSQPDAWADFRAHCSKAAPWIAQHYSEVARFGNDHVWVRRDLSSHFGSATEHDPSDDTPSEADGDAAERTP